ncbi:NYN domain-containing protein [Bergeyella sp. RCAD1439]|uniref:NYN domain-containing protein n=1 Tax=Bergeyella anatis TaxID=3113737 RepID=UPI002E184F70|nr:NYN domain-containing protein [Bergeyella sp. RCAD1439]
MINDAKSNIALLIDGDNAQSSLVKEIIEEVSKYGKATIRRIYGDWTLPTMRSWKEVLNENSLNPIQKFSYTSGKNSTDSALIIDAMDILHQKTVDGFCIVSSDSDFTGLAKRIREEGMFVMGIGKKMTPISFVNSCEIFTFTENLSVEDEEPVKDKEPQSRPKEARVAKIDKKVLAKIEKAFDISANEEDHAHVSSMGNALRKIEPSFDTRTYGFRTLSALIASLSRYEIVNNKVNGLNHPLVKRKENG